MSVADRQARHEAVAQFCERDTIPVGEAERIALFIAQNNGDRPDDRAATSIEGP